MKLPLRIEITPFGKGQSHNVVDADGEQIVGSFSDVHFDKEDAEFIVMACNAYPAAQVIAPIIEQLRELEEGDTLNVVLRPNGFETTTLKRNAAMTVSISSTPPMTEARAHEILDNSPTIRGKPETLDIVSSEWHQFTADELEAIAWWMRNKKVVA